MRALCGAIITAGALIGMGLTALGVGNRYHSTALAMVGEDGKPGILHLGDMDRPLIFILVFLTSVAIIGLGIAFLGLAYHHHRRHLEHLREETRMATMQRTSV
jgi:hypothetical protein